MLHRVICILTLVAIALFAVTFTVVAGVITSSNFPVADIVFQFEFGEFGSGPSQFNFPEGVAVDSSSTATAGNIIVADSDNDRIQVFDSSGGFLFEFGSFCNIVFETANPPFVICNTSAPGAQAEGDGQFRFPQGIAVDSSSTSTAGNIIVADTGNDRIQVFDSTGDFIRKFGVDFPGDVAVDGSGNIYVADFSNAPIQIFSSTGVLLKAFGEFGSSGLGVFSFPHSIAVDSSGNIYVVDRSLGRIQIFEQTSPCAAADELLTAVSGICFLDEFSVTSPLGVAVDGFGNIYVSAGDGSVTDFVKVFSDFSGTPIFTLDPSGSTAGAFLFPHGIAVDDSGNVYVTNTDAAEPTIHVYGLDPPPAPVIGSPADASVVTTATPTISGTAEAGTLVKVFDGTAPVGSDIASTDPLTLGEWSLTSLPLAQGTHAITATATDSVGNESPPSTTITFTVNAGANANLFISAQNSLFVNHFAGPMVVEVVVIDADIADPDEPVVEPNVTINGKKLRMVQAVDGNWYAYFADRLQAQTADATQAAGSGKGLDFGEFCDNNSNLGAGSSTVTFVGAAGVAIASEAGTGGVQGTTTIEGSTLCDAATIGATNTLHVVRESKLPVPFPSATETGQIGIDPDAWPFVQLHNFNPTDNVIVQYTKGGGVQTSVLTFDTVGQFAKLESDQTAYPQNADVRLTMTDVQLNIDPTDEDSWSWGTNPSGPTVFYQLFDENGLADADGTAGAVNILSSLTSLMFENNGVLLLDTTPGTQTEVVVTLDDNNDQQITGTTAANAATVGNSIPAGSQPMTFVETFPLAGIFTNTDGLNDANLDITSNPTVGNSAIIDYNLIQTTILVNTSPLANDDFVTTPFETSLTNIAVLENDSDAEGDSLTITSVTSPINGGTATINGTNNGIDFTPANGFRGVDRFNYTASDGISTDIATVDVAILGTNGKIAFVRGEIFVMNSDGSNQINISNNSGTDNNPAWSPDGTKIAFRSNIDDASNVDIYVMNADGSNQTNISNITGFDIAPAWSPDGTKIAFMSGRDGNFEIYSMNADGSNQVNLTNNAAADGFPSWSPDGQKITFNTNRDGNQEIYSMNADGSNLVNLTNNVADDQDPSWSPDGTKIAFYSNRDGNLEIYTMNADGSGQTRLTNDAANDFAPAWSPDGTKIAFQSLRDENTEVYVMNADGSGQTNISNNAAFDGGGTSWGTAPDVFNISIRALVAADPDGGPAGYSFGDTITVFFSEATNQPFKGTENSLTKTDLLNLFTFSQNLGDIFTGTWFDSSTLIITVVDSNGADPPTIGGLTVTVKATASLKDASLTFQPSTATSPLLTGDFGRASGPFITVFVADDPDSGDSVYSVGDTLTVRFSEATNQPFKGTENSLTKTDLLNLFEFSQTLGDGFTGTWNNPSTLIITITDITNATPPTIGSLTVTVKTSASLKNEAGNSLASTSTSSALTGSFGTFTISTTVATGGTSSTDLPAGQTIEVTLDETKAATITITKETAEVPATFTVMGDVLDVTASASACAVENCEVTFIFNQDDLDAINITLDQVTIFLDSNEDGNFQEGEDVVTIVAGTAPGPFTATADESFGSKFAVGGVKALALGALAGSLGGAGAGGNAPGFGASTVSGESSGAGGFGGIIAELDLSDPNAVTTLHPEDRLILRQDLYENQGINNIQHVSLYFGQGTSQEVQSSKTYIKFEKNAPLMISDPNDYFTDKTKFNILERNAFNFVLKYDIEFASAMPKSDMLLYVYDGDRNVAKKFFDDKIVVLPKELEIILEQEGGDSQIRVPDWIKTNAGWWAEGLISEDDFAKGIEYLIQYDIMKLPPAEFLGEDEATKGIPDWVRNTAGWWADGLIPDDGFISGIKYLVEQGIILV